MKTLEEQLEIINKGADEIIGLEDLKNKLVKASSEGTKLTIKLGLDPSAPDIHLGHTVVLRKIKQMQDLGHKAVIVIGDFTGMIGDPTGKSKARKALTKEEVLKNAATYETQIFKVLDKEKTELRFNSEWLEKLQLEEIIKLCSTMTVARMLEREDFKNRYENNISIGIHEFLYPLMQGFDSVELEADVELGGTDQRFNVLMGRALQKEFKQESQTTIFMPLLEGLDGVNKMSKSLNNYIGIDEPASVMFEKAMTIPDELIIKYYNLVTDIEPKEIAIIKQDMEGGKNPRDVKMELAKEIVTLYHGESEAFEAQERFIKVFKQNKIPKDIKSINCNPIWNDILDALVDNKIVPSKREFRRLLSEGAVRINNEVIVELSEKNISHQMIFKIGKKKFIKIVTGN